MTFNEEMIEAEQAAHDYRWECREEERRRLQQPPEAGIDPKSQAALLASNKSELAKFQPTESPVLLGTLEYRDDTDLPFVDRGQPIYVGKQHVRNLEKDLVVYDWRSPPAKPFYEMNIAESGELASKRTFQFDGLKLVAIEEVFLEDLVQQLRALDRGDLLQSDAGADALLKDLERARDGQMRDIAKTIQAAQFELISSSLNQVLIVQGGPGTGKTAIALHRVSWLIFNHPDLKPESVVVIGPNKTFLKYISQVLPDLGDRNIRVTELNGLLAQGMLNISNRDSPECAHLKGSLKMKGLLKRGLRNRVRAPEDDLELAHEGRRLRVGSGEINEYLGSDLFPSYALGREDFRRWLTEKVAKALFVSDEEARTLSERYSERCWPTLNPRSFVYELLSSQDRLLLAAEDEFLAQDIITLKKEQAARVSDQVWTEADIALVDFADELINGSNQQRFHHIVVDEAQDLSPMQLEMLKRKTSNGSMTLVGDIAQSTGPYARSSWDEVVEAFGDSIPVSLKALKYGYRVPREVHDYSLPLLTLVAPNLEPPTAVRSVGSMPILLQADAENVVATALQQVRQYAAAGRSVGLICPDNKIGELAEALGAGGIRFTDFRTGSLGSSINLVPSSGAKGLEFESIVVVDPEAIVNSGLDGLRLLYISLTRTTRDLSVVYVNTSLPLGEKTATSSGGNKEQDPAPTRAPSSPSQSLRDRLVSEAVKEVVEMLREMSPVLQQEVLAKVIEKLGQPDFDLNVEQDRAVQLQDKDYFLLPSDLSKVRRDSITAQDPQLLVKFPRAYSSWTEEEDQHLAGLADRALSIKQISSAHGRQPGAIRSRLSKLGYES